MTLAQSHKDKLVRSMGIAGGILIFLFTSLIVCAYHLYAHVWTMRGRYNCYLTQYNVLASLKEDKIIGKGSAGFVYRGIANDGTHFAVKQLPYDDRFRSANHRLRFNAHIKTLQKIRNNYIVSLLGVCGKKENYLLVYEYMPNGSLGEVLHGNEKGDCLLNWQDRYRIALHAAEGLCYLHHKCSPPIVHGNVKSSNIPDSGTSECMSTAASYGGYMAPEYARTLKFDEKTDVYSFGVVLLELLSGRKPMGGIWRWCRYRAMGKKRRCFEDS